MDDSVLGVVMARAEESPDSVALLAPGRQGLTFGRLASVVTTFRSELAKHGLGRTSRIAVSLPNGPENGVAVLAVSASSVCVPMHPEYKSNEVSSYFDEVHPDALVVESGTSSAALAVARERSIPIIELAPTGVAGAFTITVSSRMAPVDVADPKPTDMAWIVGTSGTTGARPKLVPLSHRNICVSARNVARTLRLGSSDRCLNVMPLFHLHGLVGALMASIGSGGSVVCMPGFDAASFWSAVEVFRPTWYTAVPAMHQAVLESARGAKPFRFLRSASAPLPPDLLHGLETTFGAPVIEVFGMTEVAHQVISNQLPPGVRKPSSIGIADGAEIAIVDEHGKPVPVGVRGELVLRGPTVTAGYLDNPEANRLSFVDGWLRTGDQAYIDADGYVFLTGRIKELINRGGEKISPREVDEALRLHPAVADAAAFGVPHPTLGEDLAVAVQLKGDETLTPGELRRFASERLATAKIPSRYYLVPELPRGPTGKVRRNELATVVARDRGTTRARNPIEQKLIDILNQALDREDVNIEDNFFEVGGDSLRAVKVAAMAEERGLTLLPEDVLSHPLLMELAKLVERSQPRQ